MGKKKNDNFSHFPKHRFIKKPVLLQLPFWPKIGVFQLCFLRPKTLMLNKKHNLKTGKSKDKKKGLERKSKTGNQKKEKIFQEKLNCNWKLSCCFFSWNKSKEERNMKKRQKQESKRKQKERQEGRKKTRERERQRKRNRKGGGQKRLREKERETSKINKKCPFLGGKQDFLWIKNKERKKNKTKPTIKK